MRPLRVDRSVLRRLIATLALGLCAPVALALGIEIHEIKDEQHFIRTVRPNAQAQLKIKLFGQVALVSYHSYHVGVSS